MRRAAARIAATILIPLAMGCGDAGSLADRYRVERAFWWAQRAEVVANLGGQHPDSTALLRLRDAYLAVAKQAKYTGVPGTSPAARKVVSEIARVVGHADLQAARLAVQANRPDLALDEMAKVAATAGADSAVRREADFFRVATLRQYKRYEEAIQALKQILTRYRPTNPGGLGHEDPILAVPEAIVRMRGDMGDPVGAKRELAEAEDYYRGLLGENWPPVLEAQIWSRLVRVELEQQDWDAASGDLAVLRNLVFSTPTLSPLEPDVAYSEAKLASVRDRNPAKAVAMLDQVAKDYPSSPYAGRALLESGALLERSGKPREALERYRIASVDLPPGDTEVASVATFRRAVLEEQLGDWDHAKIRFESIPVRYPDTQAAVEAPMAIAGHYVRVHARDAAVTALERAVAVYEGLIVRDTTSSFCPVYRWSIIRCYSALGDWKKTLDWIDRMAIKDRGHPVTAEALLNGSRLAKAHGLNEQARGYLAEFLASYPNSPMAPDAAREMAALGASSGAPPRKNRR